MEIDRHNYELYFIDYLDGKLNEEQTESLMAFLAFNPDLKEELAGMERMTLTSDDAVFTEKDRLLKTEHDLIKDNILRDFDMYCISSLERDISAEDEEILKDIIRADKDRDATCKIYKATRLIPDERIVYPGKAALKKRLGPIPYRIVLPAAAAAALLLILLRVFTGSPPVAVDTDLTDKGMPDAPYDQPSVSPSRQNTPAEVSGEVAAEGGSPSVFRSPPEMTAGEQTSQKGRSIQEPGWETARELIQMESLSSISLRRINSVESGTDQITFTASLEKSRILEEYEKSVAGNADDPRLSLWFLADAGVKGLNSLSEDEFHLEREKDNQGHTRRFTLDTPVFGISAPLRNSRDKQ